MLPCQWVLEGGLWTILAFTCYCWDIFDHSHILLIFSLQKNILIYYINRIVVILSCSGSQSTEQIAAKCDPKNENGARLYFFRSIFWKSKYTEHNFSILTDRKSKNVLMRHNSVAGINFSGISPAAKKYVLGPFFSFLDG